MSKLTRREFFAISCIPILVPKAVACAAATGHDADLSVPWSASDAPASHPGEGTALSERLQDPSIRPDPQAEWKNFQKPPKKRIDELFLRNKKTRYRETFDGQPLFSKMEFQPVYDSRPYFRKFYDELRAVGRP